MTTLPVDIQRYIMYLVDENKHKELIKLINEEYKKKFIQDLPPIFYLKPSLKYSAAHDEFIDVYCEYIGKYYD